MRNKFERPSFILALIAISLVFIYLMLPFLSPLLWSSVIAILFHPLHSFLLKKFNGKKNLAASITVILVTLLVVLPAIFIATTLVKQGVEIYKQLESQEINPRQLTEQAIQAIPQAESFLARFNIDPSDLKDKVTNISTSAAKFITNNFFSFGQDTMHFFINLGLFLYVSFFFIRDGKSISRRIFDSIPLSPQRNKLIFIKFREVTRATVKGNLVIALIQGTLGGIIFAVLGLPAALLWGVLMVLLSLIPVVGASLIWLPAAVIFISSGELIKGVILIFFGVIVIGLIDNILRPILIGKDTKLPDYLVLLSTIGGLTLFGMNGFILGPLTAALFVTMWSLFEKDAKADT